MDARQKADLILTPQAIAEFQANCTDSSPPTESQVREIFVAYIGKHPEWADAAMKTRFQLIECNAELETLEERFRVHVMNKHTRPRAQSIRPRRSRRERRYA